MTAGNYIPVTCAGCRQSILDASFIWTGSGMYHNHCAPRGNVTFGAPFQLPPTEDRLRQIIREELSRALGVQVPVLPTTAERLRDAAKFLRDEVAGNQPRRAMQYVADELDAIADGVTGTDDQPKR